jgi:hypothetical protein
MVIVILNFQGKLQMDESKGYGQKIRMIAFDISKYFQNPIVDIFIFGLIVYIFYKLLKYKNDKN